MKVYIVIAMIACFFWGEIVDAVDKVDAVDAVDAVDKVDTVDKEK